MKVWLVNIGEPLPVKRDSEERLFRTGYLSKLLAYQGHSVVWWTSTFNHFLLKHYFTQDTQITINKNLVIRAFHGLGYINNVSLRRLLDYYNVAFKIWQAMRKETVLPDIIVISFPPIESCSMVVNFAKKRNIPVVIDLRDMWPDTFLDMVPKNVKFLVKILLAPKFYETRKAFTKADALFGVTEGFLQWGLRYSQRKRNEWDGIFHFGYPYSPLPHYKRMEAEKFWDQLGVKPNSQRKYICFLGSINRTLNLEAIFKAADMLKFQLPELIFVICGSGDKLEYYRLISQGLPNIIMPGWVDQPKIQILMERCIAGLDPLPDRFDFHVHINNKAIEYLAGGLPIITCPKKSTLADLVLQNNCGLTYDHNDAEGLADLLINYIQNPQLQKTMSTNAKRLFEERFQAEKVYGSYISQLENIIKDHQSGALKPNRF